MLIIWLASVIIYQVFAQEAPPVSVNRPIFRNQPPPWTQSRQDQVRCFCNLPPCVATGYLCKSSSGGCFSDLSNHTKGSKGRHGCIEYLSESERVQCPIGDNHGRVLVHSKSRLVCCNNDLCNHVDNPSTRNLLNDSSEDERDGNRFHHQEHYPYSNSDVWFKAATIAVPICGAVILFVLIVLAVKILKSERDHRAFHQKLGPAMYMGPSDHKHPRWSDQPYRPCSVRKPLSYHQVHPSAFNHHHPHHHHQLDGGIRQYEMPLLLMNEGNCPAVHLGPPFKDVNESKNDALAKIGLLKCKSGSADESIMVDLGKNLSTSSVNLNNDEDKFCKSDKSFKS